MLSTHCGQDSVLGIEGPSVNQQIKLLLPWTLSAGWTTPTCTLSSNNELPNMRPGKQTLVLSKSSKLLTADKSLQVCLFHYVPFVFLRCSSRFKLWMYVCVCTCELCISPSTQARLWAQHWQRSYFLLSPWLGTQKVLKGYLLNNQVKDRGYLGTAPPL